MNKASAESDWVVTADRYVAYIDIMGFKDMILRASHGQIYKMMKRIQQKIKLNREVDWGDVKEKLIRTTTYSDSIMVYSKDESYDSLYSLICTVAGLTNDLLTEAIPHKGALAFGTMTLDVANSIFFGQPLIDAYLLQEELTFYGIIAHGSIEKVIMKKEMSIPFTIDYLCPFKKGSSVHLAVCPIYIPYEKPKHKAFVRKIFKSVHRMRYKTSGQLRIYIDNTVSYLDIIKKTYPSEIEAKS
jgi:hypothetical protein